MLRHRLLFILSDMYSKLDKVVMKFSVPLYCNADCYLAGEKK